MKIKEDIKKNAPVFSKWASLLLIIICALPFIFGFYYISIYSVNVPSGDQWDTIVPSAIQYYEGNFDISQLIRPHNDSRPIITDTIMLIIASLTQLNIKSMFYVGYAIYCVSILLLIYLVRNDIGSDSLFLLLPIPLIYYALNPYYLGVFTSNQCCIEYSVLSLAVIATVVLLAKSRHSSFCFFSSIMLGMVCTFTYAAGLSIWFAGVLQIFIQDMHKKQEKCVLWVISAAIAFYVYFILLDTPSEGLHGASGYTSFIDTTLRYPLNKFLCFMGTLGAEVVHNSQVALFFGLILLSVAIALLYVNRESLQLDRYSKWYGLLTFGMLTSLEVTLTRSGALEYWGSPETIFFIPGIRHSLVILLPILCIYILAIIYLKESITQKKTADKNSSDIGFFFQAREHKNLFIVGIIFTLLICSIILHGAPGIAIGEANYNQQIANQYYLKNYADIPDEKMTSLHPVPNRVKSQAVKLEQYNLSIFADLDPEPHLIRFYWHEPDAMFESREDILEASNYNKHTNLRIGSESMPAIFEHPQGPTGTTIVYENIDIREGSSLVFSIGIDEGVWEKPESDGVTFEIYLHDHIANITQGVFSHTLDPAHVTEDRGWHHFEIPLEEYLAENVSVQFITRPNGNHAYDWAWWGDPKIVWYSHLPIRGQTSI